MRAITSLIKNNLTIDAAIVDAALFLLVALQCVPFIRETEGEAELQASKPICIAGCYESMKRLLSTDTTHTPARTHTHTHTHTYTHTHTHTHTMTHISLRPWQSFSNSL